MISKSVTAKLKNDSAIQEMSGIGMLLKKRYGAENVFDFSLGNPDSEPPDAVKKSLRSIVDKDITGLHGYTGSAGYFDVREKIAGYLSKGRGGLTAEHIVMTCGAGGALNAALKALLNPGDEVMVLSPFFAEYVYYIDNHGGNTVIVPTIPETFLPDLDAIDAAVSQRTKAVIINSPHNPTGVIYSEESLLAIAALLKKKEAAYGTAIYVISDEPYKEIVFDGIVVPNALDIFDNIIIAYSFSKSMSLPGERIGYAAIGNRCLDAELLIEAIVFANRVLGFVNAPALFQRVIAESTCAFVDAGIYQERRDLLYNHIISLGFECVKPQGAFFLFPKSPVDTEEFKLRALKHRLIVVPGRSFGCPEHFRLAFCTSLKTIENALPAFTALSAELKMQ